MANGQCGRRTVTIDRSTQHAISQKWLDGLQPYLTGRQYVIKYTFCDLWPMVTVGPTADYTILLQPIGIYCLPSNIRLWLIINLTIR